MTLTKTDLGVFFALVLRRVTDGHSGFSGMQWSQTVRLPYIDHFNLISDWTHTGSRPSRPLCSGFCRDAIGHRRSPERIPLNRKVHR